MKERIVIIFIAVTLGLLVTTVGFFLYESSKPSKPVSEGSAQTATKPHPSDEITLTVTAPQNESLTANRTIQVKGKTDPQNTVIVSTNQEDTVVTPTSEGDFTASLTIDAGVNKLTVEAIAPNGNSKKDVRIVSFSTGDF